MSFNLFRSSREAEEATAQEYRLDASADKPVADKKAAPVKVNAADKTSGADKEGSVVEAETDSRSERIKRQSSSKVECRHCGQHALSSYDIDEDEEGEPIVSYLYCLNCGSNFPYFNKYEKEEKDKKDGLNWGAGFMLLVAMLFTVIVIKEEQAGQLFNDDSPATIESIESIEPVQPGVSPERNAPVRVLNDAEPFKIENN